MKHPQNWHTLRMSELTQKTFRWLLPLVLCLVTAMAIQAETLHAVLVIMDADQHVGDAVRANAREVRRLLTQIQDEPPLQVEMQTLLSSQHQAQEKELMERLDTLRIADEDVLFVYFSGQGGFAGEKEIVYLQNGGIPTTDLATKIQNTDSCRLKMLITDRCDAVLKLPPENHHRHEAPASQLKTLFEKHEGFLHLTSTTGKEPGWADENTGGLFTHTLLHTIQSETGSASWRDIFQETRQEVKTTFKRAYSDLPDTIKADLKDKGIDSQTPQVYRLPTGIGKTPPDDTVNLWKLKNRESNFTVDIKADQPEYRIDDRVILDVEVTAKAYVCIFNWESDGDLALVFPNRLEADNLLMSDKKHTIPQKDAKFDFPVLGPPGTERIKIVAFRNASDSDEITRLARYLRDDSARMEAKISQHLQQMRHRNWAEDSTEIEIHRSAKENGYRKTDNTKIAEKTREHPQNPQNIVFFNVNADGKYAYLAQLTDPDNQDTEEVAVHIFNEALRKAHGDTLPKNWIIKERTKPKAGWGHRQIMLSFYRNEKWTSTTDVTVYEDHYLLPKQLNGNEEPIQGDREVGFGEVRIPIRVIFE